MSGLVNVRYYKAPARLRYKVGSATGGPDPSNLADKSADVRDGLQLSIDVRTRISLAYFQTETDHWMFLQLKYQENNEDHQGQS